MPGVAVFNVGEGFVKTALPEKVVEASGELPRQGLVDRPDFQGHALERFEVRVGVGVAPAVVSDDFNPVAQAASQILQMPFGVGRVVHESDCPT